MDRFDPFDYLTLIRSGKPFLTTALVLPPLGQPQVFNGVWKGFSLTQSSDGYALEWTLDPKGVLYGLGQAVGPLNRRGKVFESWCTDDFSHTPEKKTLYGAHNFLISGSGKSWAGIFIDHPGKIQWDLGFTDPDRCRVTWTEGEFDLIFISGKFPLEVSQRFMTLSGKSYAVPRWAFGYFQSRWAYPTEAAVREVVRSFDENEMPLEGINLDIDYMEKMKVFTVDGARFPDLGALAKDLAPVKLLPILDPGIAAKDNFDAAQEGLKKGYFTQRQGNAFIGAVWPGKSYFPDFRQTAVKEWWAGKVKKLSQLGIQGYWVDMNEPALFYTPEGLENLFQVLDETRKKDNLEVEDFFHLKNCTSGLSNSLTDYKAMTQVDPTHGTVSHERVHNLYGKDMLEATVQGLAQAYPGQRTLVYTRSSFQGAQRYGGMWTGDNASWWEHILLHLRTVTSLHMQGFLYCGADVGGFTSDASAQLIIRWSQVGVVTPLFRNHACGGTRFQEPYQFDPESRKILKNVLDLRYALLAWLYSAFMICREAQVPFWRPLAFHYPDHQSLCCDDQVLLGAKVLFTPVIQNNHTGRSVYLPDHSWLCIRFTAWNQFRLRVFEKGLHWIDVGLEETCFFLAPGGTMTLGIPGRNSYETLNHEFTVIGFGKSRAEGELWEDDGETFGFEQGDYCRTRFTLEREKKKLNLKVSRLGKFPSQIKVLHGIFVTPRGKVRRATWSDQ